MQVAYLAVVMKIALATMLLFHTMAVHALDTTALVDGSAVDLLDKKCIRTDIGGVLPVRFDALVELLDQPDLILYIQKEYGSAIFTDEANDFPIARTRNGAYHYINEKNRRTDFLELYRQQTSDISFDLVYLAKGKRYFGKYEVLIHIRAVDADAAGTLYIAEIHAYPRNAALRFFARQFGTIERYFQRKTRRVAHIATQLCMRTENTPPFVYQPSTSVLSHD